MSPRRFRAGQRRARRWRQFRRRHLPRLESLEPRLVLSGVPAADTDLVSAAQATALVRGITALSQRLTEVQEVSLLAQEAVALAQPIGTLVPIGTSLRTALADRLAVLDAGSDTTVGGVKAAFAAAAAADPVLARATVTATVEDNSRLWFQVDLAGSTTLPDFALDLGQSPGESGTPSLSDQGLRLGEIEVDLAAGYEGEISFGIDLAAGLSADQTFLVTFDDLRVFGSASHTGAAALPDVEADFGVMRLGPADLDLSLDLGVTLDLREPAAGWLTLGELNAASAADWLATLSLTASGTGLDLSIPFTLDVGGFAQSGTALDLAITAADILDPDSLAIGFPTITLPAPSSAPFDFRQFAEISAADLGVFLADLGRWVPNLGTGFDLPLVGRDLSDLVGGDIRAELDGLLDALRDAEGSWRFDTAQDMLDLLAADLGTAVADFDLTWRPSAEAIEWTLPLAYEFTKSESFDASAIVPAGLPLAIGADGSASITLDAAFTITAGVAITSSAHVQPVTTSTLLSAVNGGAGLTAGMLIDGPDLVFAVRDGSTVNVDFAFPGIASGGSPGTATVGDLVAWVNAMAAGKLTLAVVDSGLVATDNTTPASPTASFSVAGPTVSITVGDTVTTATSLAPIALGLLLAPTTGNTLTGSSLESYSPRDRVYVKEATVADFSATLEATLEAGAALGPLSLSIVCGKVEGEAGVAIGLVDPGTGDADDGRIYLAELEGDIAGVIDRTLSAPAIDGIFQLQVPEIMLADPSDPASTGVDQADYRSYCSGVPLLTLPGASVPYLDLDLAADWETTGAWSFSVTPAGSLPSLAVGLGGFSIGDLPALLDLFVGYLEGSGLWNFEIPWVDLSLGDLFGFTDLFADLPAFDLGSLFGLPEYDAGGNLSWPDFSLGDLGGDFLSAFELALPDLAGLDPDLFGRLERLSWSLDDLIVEWEGWTPGSPDIDLDFLGRITAWFSGASLAFPDLLPSLPALGGSGQGFSLAFGRLLSLPQFGWQPEADLPSFNASLDLAWVLALDPLSLDFPGLDFGGLSSFGRELAGLSLPGGNPLSLTPSFDPSGRLVFTLVVDADYDTTVIVPAIDLGGVPLDVTSSGELTFEIGGTITGVFGVDLGTGEFFFDDTASGIDLTLLVNSADLAMSASLGGFAGVSLGASAEAQAWAADQDPALTWLPASVFLGASDGVSPAVFSIDGSGMIAPLDAIFTASLPLYVWPDAPPGLTNLDLGTLGLDAEFSVSPGGGIETPTLTISGIDEILANLTSLSFSFDSWIDGAADLIAYLRAALAGDLMASLPLVSRIDVSGQGLLGRLETFFETVGDYNTALDLDGWLSGKFDGLGYTRLDAKPDPSLPIERDQYFYSFFTRSGSAGSLTPLSFDDTTGFENLLGDDLELIVDLYVASATTTSLAGSQIDFGVDALGLEIVGDTSVDLTTAFVLDLGLGASLMRGFFIETDADTEFTAGIDLDLPEDLALKLGPLVFAYQSTAALPELEADLTVDLGSEAYGLTDLPDLFAAIDIGGSVRAEVAADLSAEIFAGLGSPGIGVSLAMGFDDTASPGGGAVALADLDADRFFFEITDTFIDLGGLLSGPLKEIFVSVDRFIEPIRPVLDLLTSEVPVLSDVAKLFGGGAITVLDVIRTMGGGDYDGAVAFIEAVDGVANVIDTLGSLGESSRVSLGSLSLPAGTGGDVSTASFRSGLELGAVDPGDAGFSAGDGIAATPADAGGSSADAYSTVTEGSVSFPMFEDPTGSLLSLLFGENPSLIEWDMPDLVAGFTLDQSIPIFPPLFARFFGGFEFATDFSLGYDTRGIRQAMASETVRAAKILNGVYLGDVDAGGRDKPELTFTATVGAGAELNVVVAKAGVSGGVEGILGANLKDPNDDGRVHLDELLANLRSGPECVFDLEGAIDAFFDAYIKVGFSTPFGFVTLWKDRFELFDVTLYDWEMVTCPPVTPTVAEDVGGTLVLNTGPRAGLVLPGETTDGDEVFEIDYDADRDEIIVRAYDVETDLDDNGTIDEDEKGSGARFPAAGISLISFDAGLGDDIITFTANVPTRIRVMGFGGPGNDQLTGAPGRNTLSGDGGSVAGAGGRDRILGRQSDDTLIGGDGNDILIGYGGSDTLSGDAGDDQLFGDDEAGDMSEAPEGFGGGGPGPDTIDGGDGGDLIVAGDGDESTTAVDDRVDGGPGDDTIDGGAGHDLLEGGAGNDKIYGRSGDDRIYGEDQLGRITALGRDPGDGSAIDVNADLIEGGAGFNYIHGGPGFDVIYADTAAVGSGAAAVHAAVDIVARSTAAGRGFTTPLVVTGSLFFDAVIFGGDGDDTIRGTAGRDYIDGGFESDYIEAGTGDDYLLGGPGSDAIIAAGGAARIYGGDGNDVIDGGDGVNWIEGGPGDDEIFGREGADTIYGGTTAWGYAHYLADRSGSRVVQESLHGGFTATVAADNCGPEIYFHPEVYPDAPYLLTGEIYEDLNANGSRDAGEPDTPADLSWGLIVTSSRGEITAAVDDGVTGRFTLPEEGGVEAGTYRLLAGYTVIAGTFLEDIPAGWISSGTFFADVTVGPTAPPAVPKFGYYRLGRIGGKVIDDQKSPMAGVTVGVDTDGDGAAEQTTRTAADGSYAFTGLRPGSYGVIVVDPTICGHVSSPTTGSQQVVLVSGGSPVANFTITVNLAPVVESVEIGTTGEVVTWRTIPDGPEQLDKLPAATYRSFAIEVCSSVGLAGSFGNAVLYPVDATGKTGTPLPLTFRGVDPTRANRLLYDVPAKTDGKDTVLEGRYRLVVPEGSIRSSTNLPLDGEWLNPGSIAPAGDRFPSGNGTAGGDFVFDFIISPPAAAAAGVLAGAGDWTASGQGQLAAIQGTVWVHDTRSGDLGQSASEPGLVGQTVKLLDGATGAVIATQLSRPLDLDGDGRITGGEQAAFRFGGLQPGDYVVVEEPVEPWAQATPGGVLRPNGIYAVTYDELSKNRIWAVDPSGAGGTLLRSFERLKARDLAMFDHATAWVTGVATAGNAMAAGTAGLWRINLGTGSITEVGPVPGGKPLLSIDVLDAATLLGLASDGRMLTYDVTAGGWTDLGWIVSGTNTHYYPVGDAAVVSADEVYVVCTTTPNDILDNKVAPAQILVKLDTTVRGGTATVVRSPLVASEMFIGAEIGTGGGLLLLGASGGVYGSPLTGAPLTRLGQLVNPGNGLLFGGLAAAPPEIVPDTGRLNFVLTLGGGEQVDIGFGNVPVFSDLYDGDDTIDGGCGVFGDVLHGDNGADLPWHVRPHGGNDFIRGRDGGDVIRGGQEGDQLYGEAGTDDILGGDEEGNRIDGGDDKDLLVGGPAADIILGGLGDDRLEGRAGGDAIFGGGGDDHLRGEDGGDTLVGGGGDDELFGGTGDDLLVVIDVPAGGAFAEDPRGATRDLYDGGPGSDTILVSADVDVTLTNAAITVYGIANTVVSIEQALLTGGKSGNAIDAAAFSGGTVIRGLGGADTLAGGTAGDLIFGGDDADTITGGKGNDDLRGEAGNDTIAGDGDNDTIRGGTGTNALSGGAGNDSFIVASGCIDTITEAVGAGTDTVDLTAISGALQLRFGTLGSENFIQGTATFLPSSPAVRVNLGTSPIERVLLGSGDDSILVKKGAASTAWVDAGPGIDEILYTSLAGWQWVVPVVVDLSLGLASGTGGITNVENIEGGLAGDRLFGNASPNVIRGHEGGDEIRGGDGSDTLYGMAGDDDLYGDGANDRLLPGPGVNYLDGGSESDTYVFAVDGQNDTVDETLGGLADTLDFSGITTTGIEVSINAFITATFGGSTVTADTGRIDVVKGSAKTDRFRLAAGAAYAGILDGAGTESAGLAALDILDYSAWNTPVSVSYVGVVDDATRGVATGTGGVKGLRHVIGGSGDDILKGGGLPVWLEGAAGDDRLDGSSRDDLLEGGNDDDDLSGLAGDDTLKGGWGSDTLAGGRGDDTYSFLDLFGTDTIVELPGEGADSMDFSAVTVPLEIRLGSVAVTAFAASATHAGTAIERVVGGTADDRFVMTSAAVSFAGTLDGGPGGNSLVYERATPAIVAAVDGGQMPNITTVANVASVSAEPLFTLVNLPVATGVTLVDATVRTGDQRLVKSGGGKLILSQVNSHTSGTVVEEGELVIRNLAALGSGGLEVLAGATVTLDVGFGTVPLADLSLAAGATLELGTSRITIASGASGASESITLRQLILLGRAGGLWSGATGIRSAAAAATPAGRAIGYVVNPDGSAVVMFTAVGDTNLDGAVNVFDLVGVNTAGRYGSSGTATWSDGDVNYDGRVDAFDLVGINAGGGFNAGPVSGSASVSATFASLAMPMDSASLTGTAQPSAAPLPQAFAALAVEEWGVSTTDTADGRKKSGKSG